MSKPNRVLPVLHEGQREAIAELPDAGLDEMLAGFPDAPIFAQRAVILCKKCGGEIGVVQRLNWRTPKQRFVDHWKDRDTITNHEFVLDRPATNSEFVCGSTPDREMLRPGTAT